MTTIPGNLLAAGTSAVDPSTAGWQAKLNCSIGLGSGGRNGDGALKLTSAAAGEMQAQTSALYPVVAGQLYFTFADASCATVPERIGIQWLTAGAVQVGSITWAQTTIAASSVWHRISVAGVCPVGATRARVIVSSQTPAGSGVIAYFENVYLGLPLRQAGNLLSFNAESAGELDTSAYAAGPNTTLTRTSATVAWPVTYYYSGGHSLQVAATGAGEASAVTVERAPVVAGDEYVAYAHLQPPSTAANVWIEIRYYDGSGAQLAATRARLAQPSTGWYRQIVSAIAPAGAVSSAVAMGITGATAGQAIRADGVYLAPVAIAAANTQRTGNIVPMADWNFEAGVGSWTVFSGVATIARSSPWNGAAYYDYYSLTVTSAAATSSTLRSAVYQLPPGAAGFNWRFEYFHLVTTGSWTHQRRVRWLDAGGNLISTTAASPDPMPTPNWWSASTDQVAPEGAAQAQLEIILGATAINSVAQFDRVALWQVASLFEVNTDPDNASVELVLRELSTARVMTLYRVAPDGARSLVRGADGLIDQQVIVSDAYTVVDYEAPLGVPVTYQIEFRNPATGAITGTRSSDMLTLAVGRNDVWLTDPIEPQRNLRLTGQSPPSWERDVEAAEFRVRGRRTPVILTDVRSGFSGEIRVFTQTDEERRRLHFLLDTGHTVLIRTAPGTGLEDVYVQVGSITEGRVTDYAPEQLRSWTLALTEVDRPTGGQAGSATRTWQDVRTANPTWGNVLARYATWLDVLLDRPKAG
ncbi:hypothetical protein [Streptomyces sp. NPDC054784]